MGITFGEGTTKFGGSDRAGAWSGDRNIQLDWVFWRAIAKAA
jgi:hypothetical protein